MSDFLIEMKDLATGMRAGSAHVSKENMASKVCVLSLKFDSDNIDMAKHLTTEGLRLNGRISFIKKLKAEADAEVFEFSTCNRVLYVGFDTDPSKLSESISNLVGIKDIPFKMMTGSDAWRFMVKTCSGLDSFIVGELHVMSQMRSSIQIHREHELIGTFNLAFFDHVISATRIIRKELGYNSSTESMLNLATSSLEDILSEKGKAKSIVLGFGEMGIKAVETLHELGQSNVLVASRNPSKSAMRNPELAERCSMITYDELDSYTQKFDILISTMRCSTPAYNETNAPPMSDTAIMMDFSWPPSIHQSAVLGQQTLLSMEHWIQLARNIDHSEYKTLIEKGEHMIEDIQKRYTDSLSNKAEAKFRAFIYNRMEVLSNSWESSTVTQQNEIPQLGAFAREIATWICQQNKSFYLSELTNYVKKTDRGFNSNLLEQVSQDVEQSIRTLTAVG